MEKLEFERLIKKHVSYETFKKYNAMYMSINASKEDFVKLLNIDMIEENPMITNRKNILNENLEMLKKDLEVYKEFLNNDIEFYGNSNDQHCIYWKKIIKEKKEEINNIKASLKLLENFD